MGIARSPRRSIYEKAGLVLVSHKFLGPGLKGCTCFTPSSLSCTSSATSGKSPSPSSSSFSGLGLKELSGSHLHLYSASPTSFLPGLGHLVQPHVPEPEPHRVPASASSLGGQQSHCHDSGVLGLYTSVTRAGHGQASGHRPG